MELMNDNVSELKDSTGEVLVNNTLETLRQVLLNVRRLLQLQSSRGPVLRESVRSREFTL